MFCVLALTDLLAGDMVCIKQRITYVTPMLINVPQEKNITLGVSSFGLFTFKARTEFLISESG
jgi:hypothetical protein